MPGTEIHEPPCKLFLLTRQQLEDECPTRRDGVDAETVALMRRNYGHLLQKAGEGLQIPQPTIATAVVFCHRYFAVKSMKRNDRFVVATACLFLACKVEECLRRVQKVLEMCYSVRYGMDLGQVRQAFQENPAVFEMLRDNVLVAERALLYTLGFNFRIEKPYQHVTNRALRIKSLHPEALRFLTQIAWNFVNDSLQTTLLLQHKPKHIAYGAIYLAAKFLGIELEDEEGLPWYENDGVPLEPLEEITRSLLSICEASAARVKDKEAAANEEVLGRATNGDESGGTSRDPQWEAGFAVPSRSQAQPPRDQGPPPSAPPAGAPPLPQGAGAPLPPLPPMPVTQPPLPEGEPPAPEGLGMARAGSGVSMDIDN